VKNSPFVYYSTIGCYCQAEKLLENNSPSIGNSHFKEKSLSTA